MESKSKDRAFMQKHIKSIPTKIHTYLNRTFDNTKAYYHPCLAIKFIFIISQLDLVTKSFLTDKINFSMNFFNELFLNQYVKNIFLLSEMRPLKPSALNFYNFFNENKHLYIDILNSDDTTEYDLMLEFLSDTKNQEIPFVNVFHDMRQFVEDEQKQRIFNLNNICLNNLNIDKMIESKYNLNKKIGSPNLKRKTIKDDIIAPRKFTKEQIDENISPYNFFSEASSFRDLSSQPEESINNNKNLDQLGRKWIEVSNSSDSDIYNDNDLRDQEEELEVEFGKCKLYENVINQLQTFFPDLSEKKAGNLIIKLNYNLIRIFQYMTDENKYKKFLWQEEDDEILKRDSNSVEYKNLKELKGESEINERKRFLNIN